MTNPRTIDHLAQLERQRIARDTAAAADHARYSDLFAAVLAFPPDPRLRADFPPAVQAMLAHRELVEARSKLPITPLNEDSSWTREYIAETERELALAQQAAARDSQRDPADRYRDLCDALISHPPELDKRGYFPAEVQVAALEREREYVEQRADEFELPNHASLYDIDDELHAMRAQVADRDQHHRARQQEQEQHHHAALHAHAAAIATHEAHRHM